MRAYRISEERRASGMEDKVIYQLFLRSFTEEGTIRAAAEKLPWIASLGVDIVYIVSFAEADPDADRTHWSPRQIKSGINNPRNPYRISDYTAIDPEYGTAEDVIEFNRRAHELGLLVMDDLVYLHCGPGKFVTEHPDFVQRDENGEVICNNYHFPLINFANPDLRKYLIANMEYRLSVLGFDGFRCDVGDEVPLDFWAQSRAALDPSHPGFLMLNEGERPEALESVFDCNYDFLWGRAIRNVIHGRWSNHDLLRVDEGVRLGHPDGGLRLRAYENHDFTNDSYDNRLDRIEPKRTTAALVLNFLLDGVPFLYNGNEIADVRRHSIWALPGDRNRIDWRKADTPKGAARLELTKKLCFLRHTEPALTRGEVCWEKDADLVAFSRRYGDEEIRVLMNFTKQPVRTGILGGTCLLFAQAKAGKRTVTLREGGYYIEKIEGGNGNVEKR